MILPGMAVTHYGDEIGMVDNEDISLEGTQDHPEDCNAGNEYYVAISRTPEQTPFQWNANKNAGKDEFLLFTMFNLLTIYF